MRAQSSLLGAVAAAVFGVGAKAQVPELDEVDRVQRIQVGLLIERIEIDSKVAGRLLFENRGAGSDGALRRVVGQAIEDGHGELVESSYLLTRSANRARLESALDFTYPSEWVPAGIPSKLTGPIAADSIPAVPASPTTFMSRPLGGMVEYDPVVARGGATVNYGLAPEFARLAGEKEFGHGLNRVTTPLFEIQKAQVAVRQRWGTSTLVAATPVRSEQEGELTSLVFTTTQPQVLEASPEERARLEKRIREHGSLFPEGPLPDPFATPPGDDPFGLGGEDEEALLEDPFARPDPDPVPPPGQPLWSRVSIGVEAIETSDERFSELFAGLGKYADSTRVREALEGDLDRGEARMIASAAIPTRSGQRARIESFHEHIAPTEFDPPEVPLELINPPAGDLSKFATPATFTAWEMRPEGISLEVDPVVSTDGRVVEIGIAPVFSWLHRQLSYGVDEAEGQVPLFETMQVWSAVSVDVGDDLLIAAVTPRRPESGAPRGERRVLLFLRADVIDGPTPEERNK